jgi:4-alpha-glucanotransferase
VGERQGKAWPGWPERLRKGAIEPGDYDEAVYRYHLFAQWQIERQLASLASKARDQKLLWYLDFPLGVNAAGYDTWRWPELFAWGAAGGAPPDAFFTKGQNWGFPPLHPQRLRAEGYGYLILALQRHLAYARVLRIDHAMSLQRLYWVPEGMEAKDGVYVRYPTEELFALLSLESHRHEAWIVGENLGTVSDAMNAALDEHHVAGMYVAQLEVRPAAHPPLPPVPATTVASVNTHDTPQFAAFWTGLDIDNSADLGLVSPEEASRQRDQRAGMRQKLIEFLQDGGFLARRTLDPEDVQEAILAFLASSPAPVVLVNLEDLWQEMEPQNTPGTFHERPNWRRKAKYALEEFRDLSIVHRVLERVGECRRNAREIPKPEAPGPR